MLLLDYVLYVCIKNKQKTASDCNRKSYWTEYNVEKAELEANKWFAYLKANIILRQNKHTIQ